MLNEKLLMCAGVCGFAASASAEMIFVEPEATTMLPGETQSVLFRLSENDTPLFGYSLDVRFAPGPGATGSIDADVAQTNFFDESNLISAGGAERDPDFSVIQPAGDGGVFISTNTEDGSTVLAEEGVNDVLAQVFFTASSDALGEFIPVLTDNGTALSDGQGFPVDFDFSGGSITVIPAPAGGFALLGAAVAGLAPRRSRQARSSSTSALTAR